MNARQDMLYASNHHVYLTIESRICEDDLKFAENIMLVVGWNFKLTLSEHGEAVRVAEMPKVQWTL